MYCIKDTRTHIPEASYMMIVKHSTKILGVQNSNRGENAIQLTGTYGQYADYSYWRFKELPNGNYKIINNKSNLFINFKKV